MYIQKVLGPQRISLAITVPMTLIYAAIFITGVVGNVSICHVITKNQSMQTTTNYYLFSLAVSDLSLLVLGEQCFFVPLCSEVKLDKTISPYSVLVH